MEIIVFFWILCVIFALTTVYILNAEKDVLMETDMMPGKGLQLLFILTSNVLETQLIVVCCCEGSAGG